MSNTAFDSEALAIDRLAEDARREVISAYLDDELSPEAARHVTLWLDEHPDALREVEHLRRTWALLEQYGDEPVPEGFAAGVLERVGRAPSGSASESHSESHSEEAARPSLLDWLRRPALAWSAAAVLLVALGAVSWAPWRGAGTGPAEAPPVAHLDEVPVDLLEYTDVMLTMSEEEFESVLLADLEAPKGS